jgi:hypothetical protein
LLKFSEGMVCEAIVRRLEERASGCRTGVCWPEQEGHPFPIEVAFSIAGQLYALEHTGIEPFKGHVQMEAEADRHFAPITNALKDSLGTDAVFELVIPANIFRGRKPPEIRRLQQALITGVKAAAPTLPKRKYADYRGTGGSVTMEGVPFPVLLYRFEPVLVPGHHFQIKHMVTNGDRARLDRITQAVEDKFPKLAAWKRDYGARTILVLEDNDIQLTNQAIVTDAFIPLAVARVDTPDETYLVASCMDPWHAWPILIDGTTYFELAERDHADVGWQIDQHTLKSLTSR